MNSVNIPSVEMAFDKAIKLGVEVIDEKRFMEIIKD